MPPRNRRSSSKSSRNASPKPTPKNFYKQKQPRLSAAQSRASNRSSSRHSNMSDDPLGLNESDDDFNDSGSQSPIVRNSNFKTNSMLKSNISMNSSNNSQVSQMNFQSTINSNMPFGQHDTTNTGSSSSNKTLGSGSRGLPSSGGHSRSSNTIIKSQQSSIHSQTQQSGITRFSNSTGGLKSNTSTISPKNTTSTIGPKSQTSTSSGINRSGGPNSGTSEHNNNVSNFFSGLLNSKATNAAANTSKVNFNPKLASINTISENQYNSDDSDSENVGLNPDNNHRGSLNGPNGGMGSGNSETSLRTQQQPQGQYNNKKNTNKRKHLKMGDHNAVQESCKILCGGICILFFLFMILNCYQGLKEMSPTKSTNQDPRADSNAASINDDINGPGERGNLPSTDSEAPNSDSQNSLVVPDTDSDSSSSDKVAPVPLPTVIDASTPSDGKDNNGSELTGSDSTGATFAKPTPMPSESTVTPDTSASQTETDNITSNPAASLVGNLNDENNKDKLPGESGPEAVNTNAVLVEELKNEGDGDGANGDSTGGSDGTGGGDNDNQGVTAPSIDDHVIEIVDLGNDKKPDTEDGEPESSKVEKKKKKKKVKKFKSPFFNKFKKLMMMSSSDANGAKTESFLQTMRRAKTNDDADDEEHLDTFSKLEQTVAKRNKKLQWFSTAVSPNQPNKLDDRYTCWGLMKKYLDTSNAYVEIVKNFSIWPTDPFYEACKAQFCHDVILNYYVDEEKYKIGMMGKEKYFDGNLRLEDRARKVKLLDNDHDGLDDQQDRPPIPQEEEGYKVGVDGIGEAAETGNTKTESEPDTTSVGDTNTVTEDDSSKTKSTSFLQTQSQKPIDSESTALLDHPMFRRFVTSACATNIVSMSGRRISKRKKKFKFPNSKNRVFTVAHSQSDRIKDDPNYILYPPHYQSLHWIEFVKASLIKDKNSFPSFNGKKPGFWKRFKVVEPNTSRAVVATSKEIESVTSVIKSIQDHLRNNDNHLNTQLSNRYQTYYRHAAYTYAMGPDHYTLFSQRSIWAQDISKSTQDYPKYVVSLFLLSQSGLSGSDIVIGQPSPFMRLPAIYEVNSELAYAGLLATLNTVNAMTKVGDAHRTFFESECKRSSDANGEVASLPDSESDSDDDRQCSIDREEYMLSLFSFYKRQLLRAQSDSDSESDENLNGNQEINEASSKSKTKIRQQNQHLLLTSGTAIRESKLLKQYYTENTGSLSQRTKSALSFGTQSEIKKYQMEIARNSANLGKDAFGLLLAHLREIQKLVPRKEARILPRKENKGSKSKNKTSKTVTTKTRKDKENKKKSGTKTSTSESKSNSGTYTDDSQIFDTSEPGSTSTSTSFLQRRSEGISNALDETETGEEDSDTDPELNIHKSSFSISDETIVLGTGYQGTKTSKSFDPTPFSEASAIRNKLANDQEYAKLKDYLLKLSYTEIFYLLDFDFRLDQQINGENSHGVAYAKLSNLKKTTSNSKTSKSKSSDIYIFSPPYKNWTKETKLSAISRGIAYNFGSIGVWVNYRIREIRWVLYRDKKPSGPGVTDFGAKSKRSNRFLGILVFVIGGGCLLFWALMCLCNPFNQGFQDLFNNSSSNSLSVTTPGKRTTLIILVSILGFLIICFTGYLCCYNFKRPQARAHLPVTAPGKHQLLYTGPDEEIVLNGVLASGEEPKNSSSKKKANNKSRSNKSFLSRLNVLNFNNKGTKKDASGDGDGSHRTGDGAGDGDGDGSGRDGSGKDGDGTKDGSEGPGGSLIKSVAGKLKEKIKNKRKHK